MMRKPFALLILSCVFFPLAIAAMTLTSLRPWVLDRNVYERIINDERLYDALLDGGLPNRFDQNMFPATDRLPLGALNIALREVVTVDYLRTQSLNVLSDAFDFIDGRSGNLEIGFDTTPIKAALTSPAGERFAQSLASALPACEVGQQAISPGGRLVRCIAADSSVSAAAEQIARALPAVLADMPDRIILNDPVRPGNDWGFMSWFQVGTVRTMLDIALVMVIVTTLAAALVGSYLGGDDRRERLLWLGSSLFVPAALFVLMGLIMATTLIATPLRLGLESADWYGFQYSDAFRQALTDLIMPLVQQIGRGFLLTGVVSCLIAVGLLFWGWRVPAANPYTGRLVQVPARHL